MWKRGPKPQAKLFLPLCAILETKVPFSHSSLPVFLWKRPFCRYGISLQPLQARSQPRERQTQLPNPKQNSQQEFIPSQAEHQHQPYWNLLEYSQNSALSQPLGQEVSIQEKKKSGQAFQPRIPETGPKLGILTPGTSLKFHFQSSTKFNKSI